MWLVTPISAVILTFLQQDRMSGCLREEANLRCFPKTLCHTLKLEELAAGLLKEARSHDTPHRTVL